MTMVVKRTWLGRGRLVLVAVLTMWPMTSQADLIDDIEDLDRQPAKQAEPSPVPGPVQPETPVPSPTPGETSPTPRPTEKPTEPKPETTPEAKPTPAPQRGAKKKRPGKKEKHARQPIHIKSEGQSTYSRDGGVVHLERDVVITQEDLRLQADEAKVYLAKDNAAGNDVDKVEITGNVRVAKFSKDPTEKVTAKGDRAVFLNSERKVTLIGNARLWRGGHLIKGKQITYFVDTGVITVDRAEGVVQPEEKK